MVSSGGVVGARGLGIRVRQGGVSGIVEGGAMTTTRSALIVGGGIGGATAALHLARIGWTVTALERAATAAPVGAGILLQPNGLGVLADLGLADPLEAVGHRVDAVRVET